MVSEQRRQENRPSRTPAAAIPKNGLLEEADSGQSRCEARATTRETCRTGRHGDHRAAVDVLGLEGMPRAVRSLNRHRRLAGMLSAVDTSGGTCGRLESARTWASNVGRHAAFRNCPDVYRWARRVGPACTALHERRTKAIGRKAECVLWDV